MVLMKNKARLLILTAVLLISTTSGHLAEQVI